MADTDQSGDPWAAEMAREVVGIVRAAGLEPSYDPGQFAVRYFTRPPAPPTRMVGFQVPPPRPTPDGRIEPGQPLVQIAPTAPPLTACAPAPLHYDPAPQSAGQ